MRKIQTGILFIIISLVLIKLSCEKEDDEPGLTWPWYRVTESAPAWSPCGEWIAFVRGKGIFLISPDGKEIKRWCQGGHYPAWSPCGQWIAFEQYAQIWIKKINGDSLTQLTFEGRNFFPAWSPDGNYIAYHQSVCGDIQCGLWLINLEDTTCYPIILYGSHHDFHPEKKTILFRRRWVEDRQVLGDRIFSYNYITEESTFVTALQDPNHCNMSLRINFNGEKIVFTSKPSGPRRQIWTMNIDGTEKKQLTDTRVGQYCDWSPCGNYIVYTDARVENGRLWIMDADGSNKRQLTFEHHF